MHEKHRERLRARYLEEGLDNFAPHEVLELLLTFSIPRVNTNDIGHRLMEKFGSLENVFTAQIGELRRVEGIGEKSAFQLHAYGSFARRLLKERAQSGAKMAIDNAEAAARYAIEISSGERYECTYVVSLNKRREILHTTKLAVGSLTETPIYPRTVVETVLLHRAHSVLLVHNHPSGDPSPSKEDAAITSTIDTALRSIGIQMFDHIITGKQLVYSFARGLFLHMGETVQPFFPDEIKKTSFPTKPPENAKMAAECEKKLKEAYEDGVF